MLISKLFSGNKGGTALTKLREVVEANRQDRIWLENLPAQLKREAQTAYERFRQNPDDKALREWLAANAIVPNPESGEWAVMSARILAAILAKATARSLEPTQKALAEIIESIERQRDTLLDGERERASALGVEFRQSKTVDALDAKLVATRNELRQIEGGDWGKIDAAIKFCLDAGETPRPRIERKTPPIEVGWDAPAPVR